MTLTTTALVAAPAPAAPTRPRAASGGSADAFGRTFDAALGEAARDRQESARADAPGGSPADRASDDGTPAAGTSTTGPSAAESPTTGTSGDDVPAEGTAAGDDAPAGQPVPPVLPGLVRPDAPPTGLDVALTGVAAADGAAPAAAPDAAVVEVGDTHAPTRGASTADAVAVPDGTASAPVTTDRPGAPGAVPAAGTGAVATPTGAPWSSVATASADAPRPMTVPVATWASGGDGEAVGTAGPLSTAGPGAGLATSAAPGPVPGATTPGAPVAPEGTDLVGAPAPGEADGVAAPTSTAVEGAAPAPDAAPRAAAEVVVTAPVPAPAAPVAVGAPGATAPATASHPAQPLHAQVVGPVVALAEAGDGDHVLTLSVTPENLGPVTVRAHVAGGDLRIELYAPHDTGREALRAIVADLRRDLAGIAGGASSVTVADAGAPGAAVDGRDGRGATADGSGSRRDPQDPGAHDRGPAHPHRGATDPDPEPTVIGRTYGAARRLDVLV
ncbi:flagellar hook-length control protein FliK [Cellulosimicrobium sp. 4261]|uniref:flagellar hook-length control protein FliK n=1 Tax=Cellulosimicrobium sp. 4261 TaxID=3156458 RepID=UPI0033938189